LAVLKDPSAAVEGLSWFKNLADSDALARLPMLACALGILNQQVATIFVSGNITS
jgi:hypothetical protein